MDALEQGSLLTVHRVLVRDIDSNMYSWGESARATSTGPKRISPVCFIQSRTPFVSIGTTRPIPPNQRSWCGVATVR